MQDARSMGGLALAAASLVWACGGGADTAPETSGGGGFITGVGGSTSAAGGTAGVGAAPTGAGGSGSGSGGSATTGSGGGSTCSDQVTSEPNNSIDTAFKMTEDKVDDCDSDDTPVTISGTIAGPTDIDWYWYEGEDGLGACVDPGRRLVQSESGIRICKYVECKDGDEVFDCPEGTSPAQEDGRDGCCAMDDFDLPDLSCTGTLDDAANVYIRLDQPGATADTCNAYTLSVDF